MTPTETTMDKKLQVEDHLEAAGDAVPSDAAADYIDPNVVVTDEQSARLRRRIHLQYAAYLLRNVLASTRMLIS